MKSLSVAVVVLITCVSLQAQERLSRPESLKYAFFLTLDLKQMLATPIPTDPDVKRLVALRAGERGVMLLPESKLTPNILNSASSEVIPVGQLWAVRVAPVVDGQPVPANRLRLVEVKAEGGEVTVACCALGVKKNAEGVMQLLVYGKEKEPLLRVPLKPESGEFNAEIPIDITAEHTDNQAELTLKVLGRYRGVFAVGEGQF